MLFPSTLLIYKNSFDSKVISELIAQLDHQLANNPDLLTLTEYDIKSVRQLDKFISLKPYAHSSKIIIIPDAHLLSLESQNTLLKNLEEPKQNYFILTTNHPAKIITTVLSRCHQIILDHQNQPTDQAFTLPKTLEQALLLSDSLAKNKVETINYLESQLESWQKILVSQPNPKNHQIINQLIHTLNLVNANVDPKSALDSLFINLL
ncbi:MAG TPA: AAA family ATPase [Candidatus Woesebacteria bacterium]|nr:AAA family ATPase [Candidatus Woesebacteria bacterium]HPJ17149.1 AAA family ATPase [Candidatus Woesebacteria bacterium]